jgi:hypothetical protein
MYDEEIWYELVNVYAKHTTLKLLNQYRKKPLKPCQKGVYVVG